MKCESLCLVLFFAVAAYSYPQRIKLVGLPNSPFGNFYASSPRDGEEGAGDSSDEKVFEFGPGPNYDSSEVGSSFYPGSFADIMRSMQETMFHLRQEMDTILSRIPEQPDDKGLADRFPIFDLDLSDVKNKSTSETKIIDGQLVTVNETVIKSGDDDGGAIFRVKTIQVRPTESNPTDSNTEIESTLAPEINSEAEPANSKNDDTNDIPNFEGKMRFTEWDSTENENAPSDLLNEVETTNDIEMVEPTNIKPVHYDLSRDTLVNDYISDQHESQGLVMINPDAELIDVDKINHKQNEYYRYESEPVQINEDKFEKL